VLEEDVQGRRRSSVAAVLRVRVVVEEEAIAC